MCVPTFQIHEDKLSDNIQGVISSWASQHLSWRQTDFWKENNKAEEPTIIWFQFQLFSFSSSNHKLGSLMLIYEYKRKLASILKQIWNYANHENYDKRDVKSSHLIMCHVCSYLNVVIWMISIFSFQCYNCHKNKYI